MTVTVELIAFKKGISGTHSRIGHYFFSYLLTCEVPLIEFLEIMAQMLQYLIFLSLKLIKVSSVFNLNYFKKSCRGRHHSEISKTNTKTLIPSIWIRPQGSQGCQKMRQGPLNTPFEVWSAKIAPKLKNIQKCPRKQGFFDIFLSILKVFRLCAFLRQS